MNTAQRYVIVQFILFALLVACMMFFPAEPASPLKLVGIVLILVGIGIFIAAIVAHNQTNQRPPKVSPTPSTKAHLVSKGIYGLIRHPIYTGVLAFTLGASLYHGAIANLVVWAVLVVFFWMKSSYEEKLLKQQYPEYRVYMKKTGRFIPGM